jgi:glycosyltransferase involved in cell wall biosynthesis
MKKYLAVFGAASMIDYIFIWYPDFLKEHLTDVTVIAPERSQLIDSGGLSNNFVQINIPRKPSFFKDIIALYQLFSFIRAQRFEFIHSFMPKAGFTTAICVFLLRLLFSRNIVYVHTFTGLAWSGQKGLKSWILSRFDLFITIIATYVLVESQGVLDEVVSLNKNCHPRVIGCGNIAGVNLDYFKPNADFKENGSKNGLDLVFVGRVSVDKGIFDILSIFEEKYSFDIKLDIVGSLELNQTDRDRFFKIVNATHRINYMGFQSDIRPYVQKADYLIFGSWREGFANVVLQSLALGVPVVSSKVNGIQDILDKLDPASEIGFFYDAKNTDDLKRLISKAYDALGTSKYTEMQTVAVNLINSNFSSQIAYDGLKSFYQELRIF